MTGHMSMYRDIYGIKCAADCCGRESVKGVFLFSFSVGLYTKNVCDDMKILEKIQKVLV